MNIGFVTEFCSIIETWSTPKSIKIAFEKLGYNTIEFGYDPNNCNFDDLISRENEYDFLVVWSCGPHPTLDGELKRLKSIISKKILLELGDEPQTKWMNVERIHHADAIFTPDLRCHLEYKSKGINSHWLTHWGDESIFNYNESIIRENKCVTTCGDRGLESIQNRFGELFINKRIPVEENHNFYNSGTICLQRSSNNEITRRIFEAGGCKLAVVTDHISSETGIYDLFKHGEDILYYNNIEEAINHIEILLKDQDLRNYLANNLFNKVNTLHRSETRTNQLISIYKELKNN